MRKYNFLKVKFFLVAGTLCLLFNTSFQFIEIYSSKTESINTDTLQLPKWEEGKWIETKSGLKYRVISKGNRKINNKGDTVLTHYIWYSEQGKPLFSTYETLGKPQELIIGISPLIKGFEEMLLMMNEGCEVYCKIPPELSYGSEGRQGQTTICYYIKILKVSAGNDTKVSHDK